jgi:hypothetical protein
MFLLVQLKSPEGPCFDPNIYFHAITEHVHDKLEISMHVIDDCDGFAYIFFPLRASPEFHYQGNEIIEFKQFANKDYDDQLTER